MAISKNIYGFLLACLLVYTHLAFGTERTIQVVIFSGANNHNWEETTPYLENILKSDPNFKVAVINHPETITAEQFAPCDVIVSNWNNFGKPDLAWPESVRQAFIQYIKNGGGHVTVHAGGSSFNDWTDYHQVAAYWGTDTGHGPRHEFTVKSTGEEHPIVRGIEPYQTFDELWHNTHFPPNSTVLMTAFSSKDKGGTGENEAVLTVNRFGKGRCVNFMLGHDALAMKNPGFEILLRRSVEWAAANSREHTGNSFQKTDHSIALVNGDKTVWQFNYGNNLTKPYFHPLALSDGTVLTWEAPADHPWHHGLWFSWKYINGVNYWEEDRTTGKSAGMTTWDNVSVQTNPDGSAKITMDISYHEPQKLILLTEKRTITLSAPDELGTYTIDWTSTFTAADRVELNRTPLPWEKDGKDWGGYAGFSFRANNDAKDVQFLGTFGAAAPVHNGRYRFKDVACEYSGQMNNTDFGVTILDHPENLNFPTPWYVNDTDPMVFFSPVPLCYGPHTMSGDESLTLKYRMIIHFDRWNSQQLLKQYNQFTSIQ